MSHQRPPIYAIADILTLLGVDPNAQYIPVRQVLQRIGLAPASYERALRRIPVLANGLKPLWIVDEEGARRPALCLRVDLLPLWLCSLPAKPGSDLAQWQHEAASAMWQQFKPNGATAQDGFVPDRYHQNAIEQAYVQAHEVAALARHQLLGERELYQQAEEDVLPDQMALVDVGATQMVKTTRQTATTSAQLTKRNDYLGIFIGLVRVFQIYSFRHLPEARLAAAIAWLEQWQSDIENDTPSHTQEPS